MKFKFMLLIFSLLILMLVALSLGPYELNLGTLFGFTQGNVDLEMTTVINYRWSKVITAIAACSGLGIAGLLMQSFFQNPLAGPDVFGLTSGASIGVALSILAQSYLFHYTGMELNLMGFSLQAIAAFLGSLITFALINLFSLKYQSRSILLIFGLLISSFLSGFLSFMISLTTKDELRDFVSWGLGSFERLSIYQAIFTFLAVLVIAIIVWFMSNSLNLILLGDEYAKTSGLEVRFFKKNLMIITCLLTALITAVCGPLAFVGIIGPHLARIIFKTSNHKILILSTLLMGAIFGLIVVIILSLQFTLPLPANAVMGFLGAPVLLVFLLKRETSIA